MPSLILSSRYTTDSQILRKAADRLGWQTVRIDGSKVPDWFDPSDDAVALFYTPPHAFEIAAQLSRTLLGCSVDWMLKLPTELVRRDIRLMTLREALQSPGQAFVKHALAKAFPAAIHDARSLAEATAKVQGDALVYVAEPVEWSVEYRCFVRDRRVATISPYRRFGNIIEDHSDLLGSEPAEIAAAETFAARVLADASVECPPAFVLDVGIIAERGWAVVECNEAWASGIYACDPEQVLATLLRACHPTDRMTERERPWDFRLHYQRACP
jgi:hypothetical protein